MISYSSHINKHNYTCDNLSSSAHQQNPPIYTYPANHVLSLPLSPRPCTPLIKRRRHCTLDLMHLHSISVTGHQHCGHSRARARKRFASINPRQHIYRYIYIQLCLFLRRFLFGITSRSFRGIGFPFSAKRPFLAYSAPARYYTDCSCFSYVVRIEDIYREG